MALGNLIIRRVVDRINKFRSSVSPEGDCVSPSVVGSAGRTGLGVEVALHAQASARLACRSDASQLSVLLMRSSDPVDARVVADGVVGGVHQDHLVVFVGSVLGNPVTVEHSQATEGATDTLLSLGAEVAGGLELVDTHGGRLSSHDTLGDGSLAASSADAGAVDDVAVLGLVAEFAGLVGARGVVDSGDDGELTVLPGADSEDEVHEVALFLAP